MHCKAAYVRDTLQHKTQMVLKSPLPAAGPKEAFRITIFGPISPAHSEGGARVPWVNESSLLVSLSSRNCSRRCKETCVSGFSAIDRVVVAMMTMMIPIFW